VYQPDAVVAMSAAPDGGAVAVVERERIAVVDPASLDLRAEIGADPAAEGCDVAWAGRPSRLVVVQRYRGHAVVHLIDVAGDPRKLGEGEIDQPVHALATGLHHALLGSDRGALVVGSVGDKLAIGRFQSVATPTCAGAFGPHQFVVAANNALEEWDAHACVPRRRFRLPRPARIRLVGGTSQLLWMVSHGETSQIDVIPLVNRGQPRRHELAEPVAAIAAHARVDALVWIGATTGQAFEVDLESRDGARAIGPTGVAAAVVFGVGTSVRSVLAISGQPLVGVDLAVAGRGSESRSAPTTTLSEAIEQASAEPPPLPIASPRDDTPVLGSVMVAPPPEPVAAVVDDVEPMPAFDDGQRWRDQLAVWTRAALSRPAGAAPPLAPIEALVERFDLEPWIVPGLALLYGAHLLGQDGVAPVALSRTLDHRWDEALGRGVLAANGLARWRRSRVRLARVLRDALDELPARTGTLVGEPGGLVTATPCVVRTATGRAADAADLIGGLSLIVDGEPRLAAVIEARARGAIALFEASSTSDARAILAFGRGTAAVIGPDVDAPPSFPIVE
jgi:hypothetical protein